MRHPAPASPSPPPTSPASPSRTSPTRTWSKEVRGTLGSGGSCGVELTLLFFGVDFTSVIERSVNSVLGHDPACRVTGGHVTDLSLWPGSASSPPPVPLLLLTLLHHCPF
jgi:hypothetical protein